jgi:hypothetical protein
MNIFKQLCRTLVLSAVIAVAMPLLIGGCMPPPPPLRPAMSQTVITVQRYSSNIDANVPMEIFIDGNSSNVAVPNGGNASVIVNDGVHYIYVKVGRNQSEMLNFTAAQRTVSFTAHVDGGFLQKTKVILSRSKVIDDTGKMTDKEIQERYNHQE